MPRSLESLGWLSQSGVQPKKQRVIEGAPSSLVQSLPSLAGVSQPHHTFTSFLGVTSEACLLHPRPAGSAGRCTHVTATLWHTRGRTHALPTCSVLFWPTCAGVSASSLVAFKTELYKVQQEAAAVKEGRLDPEELRLRVGEEQNSWSSPPSLWVALRADAAGCWSYTCRQGGRYGIWKRLSPASLLLGPTHQTSCHCLRVDGWVCWQWLLGAAGHSRVHPSSRGCLTWRR